MNLSPRVIQSIFRQRFNSEPLVVRAPGRINLIGEHTDYNDGFVMPAAVDREIWFAIGPSDDSQSVVYSYQYDEEVTLNLANPLPLDSRHWANYLLGVIKQLIDHGYALKPFRCAVGGDIPTGAGMSSSAALECGFATALALCHQHEISPEKIARMAQWAEHHYAGVRCGIMDQFASTMGKRDHVILLDCQTMEYRYLPFPQNRHAIVLCDSRVKHSLADSEYNVRRHECETGVRILQAHYPKIRSLRDVDDQMLQRHRDALPEKVYDRCAYVVGEIARVRRAAKALEGSDLETFGQLMFETHDGLSSLYEVSCDELDFLVNEARQIDGVVGARMMGGGFGGCTINLIEIEQVKMFIETIPTRYHDAFNREMAIYQVKIVDGAGQVPSGNLH